MSLTNIYSSFASLSKVDLMVGTVKVVGTESSTLEDMNGYEFIAIGTSVSVDNKAFVLNGIIQGLAPDLTESEVLV